MELDNLEILEIINHLPRDMYQFNIIKLWKVYLKLNLLKYLIKTHKNNLKIMMLKIKVQNI